MKKTWLVAAMATIISPVIYAAQNTELTQTDDSIKEFQRKVMWLNPENGYESRKVKASVIYCPYQAKKCIPQGTWTFRLEAESTAQDSAHLSRWVGLKRFDQVTSSTEALSLSNPYNEISLKQAGKNFKGGVMSFNDYKQHFVSVLTDRANTFGDLLSQSLEMRAETLRNKESGTAATHEMKTFGLNLETIQGLMDDGYAFSAFVPRTQANVTISQNRHKTDKGYVYTYSTNVTVPTKIKLLAYQYQPESRQFTPYTTWEGQSGSVSESNTFKFKPNRSAVEPYFKKAYATAYKAAALDVALDVKRDEHFNLKTQVTSADWWTFESNLHAGLDLRVDSLWTLSRKVDGETERTGSAKARVVAHAPTKDAEAYSQFQAIKGGVEIGDQLSEHPWNGVQGFWGIEQTTYLQESFMGYQPTDVNGQPLTENTITLLTFGKSNDTGYLNNDPDDASWWTNYSASLGIASEGFTLTDQYGGRYDFSNPFYLGARMDKGRVWYLAGSGLFIMPAAGLGLDVIFSSGTTPYSGGKDASLTAYEATFDAGLTLGYTTDRFSNLKLTVRQSMPLFSGSQIKEGEDIEWDDMGNDKFGQGLTIGLTYHWNLDSIGNSARHLK